MDAKKECNLPGQIRVLSTTAMKSSLDNIMPLFEQDTGHSVVFTYTPSAQILHRVVNGDTSDIIIATAEVVADLIALGKIVAGSDAALARSQIGLAVRRDAPTPDISSAGKFKTVLLEARAIGMSNPVGGGQSGRYLVKIFEQLGIADTVKAKAIYGPGGPAGLIGHFLARGEVDVGLQQMAELCAVPDIQVVGPLPPDIQRETVFSAGLSHAAAQPKVGRMLIQALCGRAAAAIIATKGFTTPPAL